MAQWELAGKARNDFADMIESLTDEQLATTSLCDEWDAQGVARHVTSFVETGLFGMFRLMVKSRFDFDKVSVAMADQLAGRSTADVLSLLRANATKSAPLPTFPEAMTVADVAVHGQDVRRPLGITGGLDEQVLRASLDFLTTHKLATTMVDRRPIDDVRLEATDIDWSFGTGDVITGTGEALLMGLANRPVVDELSGPGVKHWAN